MKINQIKKLFNIFKCFAFIKALFNGSAAGTEHISVLKNLNSDFIVDVGANRGQFALVSRKIFPDAKIHSFEPLDEPAKIFETVFLEDSNVHLHRCAIGSENKTMAIHVSEHDDSSSLLPIGKKQSELFPHTGESEIRETLVQPLFEAISIDEISSNALLKIDVQGFELEVLKGCQSTLSKFTHVYVECSFIELYEGQALANEIIDFLHKNNFVLIGIHNTYYSRNGQAVQADFLFKKTTAST
jgi:FkbM family methyltransferase